MSDTQLDLLLARFGVLAGSWSETTPLARMRADLEAFYGGYETLPGSTAEPVNAGGVPSERVSAGGASTDRWIFVLHGGGFSTGSARAHRAFASYLSASADARVLTIDYRLAPEHPYPAAFEDAVAAYEWLLANGVAPKRIAICGDSAGGGLAAALLLYLRDQAKALPACAVLLSPWADLACRGASYDGNAAIDPIANKAMAMGMAATYLGSAIDPTAPHISAVYAYLGDLPPIFIQAGEREIFLDDAVSLKNGIDAAGGEAAIEIVPGMIHQYQLHVGQLDESRTAIERIGAFIRGHIA